MFNTFLIMSNLLESIDKMFLFLGCFLINRNIFLMSKILMKLIQKYWMYIKFENKH